MLKAIFKSNRMATRFFIKKPSIKILFIFVVKNILRNVKDTIFVNKNTTTCHGFKLLLGLYKLVLLGICHKNVNRQFCI